MKWLPLNVHFPGMGTEAANRTLGDLFMSMTVFQQYKDHYSKNTLINNDDEWVKLDMFTHPGFI